MATLAGVRTQNFGQADYVPEGLQRGAEQRQSARAAAGEAGSPRAEQARFAKRADDVVQSGRRGGWNSHSCLLSCSITNVPPGRVEGHPPKGGSGGRDSCARPVSKPCSQSPNPSDLVEAN